MSTYLITFKGNTHNVDAESEAEALECYAKHLNHPSLRRMAYRLMPEAAGVDPVDVLMLSLSIEAMEAADKAMGVGDV